MQPHALLYMLLYMFIKDVLDGGRKLMQVMSTERKKRFGAFLNDISNMVQATQQYFEKLVQQLEVGLHDIDRQYVGAH